MFVFLLFILSILSIPVNYFCLNAQPARTNEHRLAEVPRPLIQPSSVKLASRKHHAERSADAPDTSGSRRKSLRPHLSPRQTGFRNTQRYLFSEAHDESQTPSPLPSLALSRRARADRARDAPLSCAAFGEGRRERRGQ